MLFKHRRPRVSFLRSKKRIEWSREQDLNPRPAVYKTAALPTELSRHNIQTFLLAVYGERKLDTPLRGGKLLLASPERSRGKLSRPIT